MTANTDIHWLAIDVYKQLAISNVNKDNASAVRSLFSRTLTWKVMIWTECHLPRHKQDWLKLNCCWQSTATSASYDVCRIFCTAWFPEHSGKNLKMAPKQL